MPFDEHLVLDHAVVVELFAKSCSKFLGLWLQIDEELDHSLKQMLDAVILILGDESGEHLLKFVPVLDDVSVSAKNSGDAQIELVFRGDVELKLELASLTNDIIAVDGTFCLLFSDKSFQFLAGIHYKNVNRLGT